jgi:hypothetical protein
MRRAADPADRRNRRAERDDRGSSALAEQVVADVIASAFDSAGQRCSALRVLCLQDDVADRTLAMLRGAMAELALGNPDELATDVGPVITAQARDGIEAHVAAMAQRGAIVHPAPARHLRSWHVRCTDADRNSRHRRTGPRSVRPGAARGALCRARP